jgi:hypothetical protein
VFGDADVPSGAKAHAYFAAFAARLKSCPVTVLCERRLVEKLALDEIGNAPGGGLALKRYCQG